MSYKLHRGQPGNERELCEIVQSLQISIANLNVVIETKSLLLRLLASDGSDGDDMFVNIGSSHTSDATSTGAILLLASEPNGLSLNMKSLQSVVALSVSARTVKNSESSE